MPSNPEKIRMIYITGGGHSGSTILSFILGTAPEVFNAGELKFFNAHQDLRNKRIQYMKNTCSCGEEALECPFWENVEERIEHPLNIFHQTSIKERLWLALKILLPFYHFPLSEKKSDDYFLSETIRQEACQIKPSTSYLLDASKNLARLVYLNSHQSFNLKVIFLIRDGRGFVNSYHKAEGQFWRWVLEWIILNFLMLRYLNKEKVNFFHLSYDQFCTDPMKYLRQFNAKFNLHLPLNYVESVRETIFHVRAGNPLKSDIRTFSGLKRDEKYQSELSKVRQGILSVLLEPFNQRWVYHKL